LMHRIDEASRRRPDFAEGQPLELRDGQVWHLRLPTLVVSPTFVDGRVADIHVGPEGVPDYDRLAAVIYGEERVKNREYWEVRFRVAAMLLTANYRLEDAELSELLSFRRGDHEDDARLQVLEDVFLGILPEKPAPAGSN
jgi:hypothetical protein